MTKSSTTGTPTREETLTPTELQRRVEDHPFLNKLFGGEPSAHSVRNLEGRETLPTLTALNPEDSNNLVNLGPFSQEAAVQAGTKVRVLVFEPLDNEQDIRMEIVLKQIPDIGFTFRDKARIAEVLRDHYKPLAKQSQGTKGNNFGRWEKAAANHFPASGNKLRPDWWWGKTNIHKSLYIWDRRPGGEKAASLIEPELERARELIEEIEEGKTNVHRAYKSFYSSITDEEFRDKSDSKDTTDDRSESDETDDTDNSEEQNGESGQSEETDEQNDDEDTPTIGSFTNHSYRDSQHFKAGTGGNVVSTPVVGWYTTRAREMYWKKQQEVTEYLLDDKLLDWWSESSVLGTPHRYAMMNVVSLEKGISNRILDERPIWKIMGFDHDVYTIADSGAYQIESHEDVYLYAKDGQNDLRQGDVVVAEVMKSQLRNADAGMILEVPPSGDTESQWKESYWTSLKQTVENARVANSIRNKIQPETDWKNKNTDDFDLFGVIQGKPDALSGQPYESYREWHERLKQVTEFEGYAFGQLDGGLSEIALCLAYGRKRMDTTRLHFLGAGSPAKRALLEFAGKRWDDLIITHDSSTSEYKASDGKFIRPRDYNDSVALEEISRAAGLPCQCDVCARVASELQHKPLEGDWHSALKTAIVLHNVRARTETIYPDIRNRIEQSGLEGLKPADPRDIRRIDARDIETNSGVWEKLAEDYETNHRLRRLYDAMRFLVDVDEMGLDTACDEWSFSTDFNSGTTTLEPPAIESQSVVPEGGITGNPF